MGAFKEIYDEFVYSGESFDESLELEGAVDLFSELLPGFEQALAFERPVTPLRFNPFAEVATPIKPLGTVNCLIR